MRLGLVDGLIYYGQSLDDWARAGWLAQTAAQHNVKLAPPDGRNVTNAAPATAWVNEGLWVATCPHCEVQTLLVWLDAPIYMCPQCWNGDVGGKWRRVIVPAGNERLRIENALIVRARSDKQNWIAAGTPGWVRETTAQVNKDPRILAGQTPADLERENDELGLVRIG